MSDKVNRVDFAGEFRICPLCGYRDGFHTMLKKEGEKIKWMFICPSCHEVFDVGYAMDSDTIPVNS